MSKQNIQLVICDRGTVHFPGGGIADTGTLCGFGPGNAKETDEDEITCHACAEIIKDVKSAKVKINLQKP